MAYYLMLESKKGEYIPMNISSSLYFTTNPHYKKEGACTLNEIDLFTACFENEEEMRMHLLENGIMPINKKDKRLSIRISNRGHYNKVLHGFLFRKDLEYINNPYKLIDMIMKRYYGNNLMLIHHNLLYIKNKLFLTFSQVELVLILQYYIPNLFYQLLQKQHSCQLLVLQKLE